MSADLHIHSMRGVTEQDLGCFFSNTLGSKWFQWWMRPNCIERWKCKHHDAVLASGNIWIGQVSWLKAALTESDEFIPEPVQAIHELIGEHLPILDAELKDKILQALTIPNERASFYNIAERKDVEEWLDRNMGQKLFTVSW